MLSSEERIESDRLTDQVGQHRPTHFRQQTTALTGPTPEQPTRRRVRRKRSDKGVRMRIGFTRQPGSEEEFLSQEIL
jgi:hypothetical protein